MNKAAKFYKRLKTVLWINKNIFTTKSIVYYSLYLIFTILGCFYHLLFFCFLLIEIVNKYSTLKNFLRAITLPWRQLFLTFVLYLIIEYIFTIWAYNSFYIYYDEEGKMCQNMWMCFLTTYDMTFKVRFFMNFKLLV